MAKSKLIREVELTETAEQQLTNALEYWIEQNKSNQYAIKLLHLISRRCSQLKKQPLSAPESEYPETRVASLGHYSLYYKILSNKIVITAFWDNRQDPKKLLKLIRKELK